jgi:hypothetical protein
MTQNIDLTAMQTPETAVKRNCGGLKRGGVVGEWSGTEMVVKLLFTWTN